MRGELTCITCRTRKAHLEPRSGRPAGGLIRGEGRSGGAVRERRGLRTHMVESDETQTECSPRVLPRQVPKPPEALTFTFLASALRRQFPPLSCRSRSDASLRPTTRPWRPSCCRCTTSSAARAACPHTRSTATLRLVHNFNNITKSTRHPARIAQRALRRQ